MAADELTPLHGTRAISRCVRRIASAIDADSRGKPLTVIGVLNGSFVFLADLLRLLDTPVTVDFVRIASYGKGVTPGSLRLVKDVEADLRDRRVLVVEDIVDTGSSAAFLLAHLRRRRPRSLKLCALLDKPARRVVDITLDYRGFVVPDIFIVGYGLDLDERYRQLPGLYSIEPPSAAHGRSSNG